MVGGHKGLPDLALLALAVAQDSEHLGVLAQVLGAQGHAHRDGYALAQGAGGGVHAGDLLHVGVALEDAVELAEVLELRLVKEAQLRQDAVVAGGGVALAEDEAVPVGIPGVLGIDPHLGAEDGAHQLRGGQGAAGVAAAGVGRHVDDVAANFCAELFEFCCVHGDTSHQNFACP